MSALAKSGWLLTVDEYLAFEEQSEIRHEYVGGEIHAMAGATLRHARIVANLFGHLWSATRNGPCQTVSNDMKVQVASNVIYYPDIVVTCDPEDQGPLILKNPIFIGEVLSPSTAATDRREKMMYYRQLPSLLCYLIVHQEERRIERHWRDSVDAPWELDVMIDGGVSIPRLEVEMTFDEIYEGVETG